MRLAARRAARLSFCAAAGLLLAGGIAAARVMPLERLPDASLVRLAPVLVSSDVALIESHPDGRMKQVTLLLYVRARPETVHALLARPGEFSRFVRNVSKSSWEPTPDGNGGKSVWRLDLPVSSFTQTSAYAFEPGPTGAVVVTSPDPAEDPTWRWEMLPVPGAAAGEVAGTLLVQYGYTDVKNSNSFVRSFLKKMPVTEHGLALAAQLMLASNIRREAEARARASGEPLAPAPTVAGTSPGFGFLLDRGQVAVMRSRPDGRLAEVSLLDRIYAPLDKVKEALVHPGEWRTFVPGVDESRERRREGDVIGYVLDFVIPMARWSSAWAMRVAARAVDGAALEGDLAGARYRWDLTPRGPSETLAVYRVSQELGKSSMIFRTLMQHDPSLEHGLNVAFSLVYLRAVRGRAEGWKQ